MDSNSKGIYKEFRDPDINASKRVLANSLFETKNVLEDPWNNYESETISSDLAPINYIKRTETDVYFSYARGEYIEDVVGGSESDQSKALMYYQMVQLMGLSDSKYPIKTETIDHETDEIDIISISRNYYKDMIDREFFGLFIKDQYDELVGGLFPGDEVRTSDIGRRAYLYKYTGNDLAGRYDSGNDSLTIPSQSDLDKSQPYGEIHLDSGIIVLFLDHLQYSLGITVGTEVLDYLKSFGGNSKIQVNSTIYSAILFNDEYNHSTNPTYYSEAGVIKSIFRNFPITYPTMIGLYNENNQLIAVGRFSKTFQKNPLSSATIKAELSY